MNIIIKSAVIICPSSKYHGKKRDILIKNGKIEDIKASISTEGKKISFPNLHVSLGWFDLCANFNDPGFEHKEDIETGLKAAASGGFTDVMITPATNPVISNKAMVEYALRKSEVSTTNLHVAGSLSSNKEGKQVAEYYDMMQAKALAFTDYKSPVNNAEMMHRALDYAKNYNTLVMSFPFDNQLCPDGQINEGQTSVSMGLKGMPNITEEIRLARDIELLRYTESKMHVLTISTAKSVEIIRQAKKEGLAITCSIAAHQLSFIDEDLQGYDTRLKVIPPFRTPADRNALIKGLKDGTIDVIISDHSPQDIESKKREFEHATFGISSIESAFGTANKQLGKEIGLDSLIEKITTSPREIIGQDLPKIEKGELAILTLFDPQLPSEFDSKTMISKSKNTPFTKKDLTGKVFGIINGKSTYIK